MHDDDGHVLGGQGEPSYDEHDDDGHVLGGQGDPSYDEHEGQGVPTGHHETRSAIQGDFCASMASSTCLHSEENLSMKSSNSLVV